MQELVRHEAKVRPDLSQDITQDQTIDGPEGMIGDNDQGTFVGIFATSSGVRSYATPRPRKAVAK